MPAVRVLVVDDHRAFAEALAARLSIEPDLEVLATVPTTAEALRLTGELQPDVVTVDVDLGGEDGVELASRLSQLVPAPRVVMLTGVDDVRRTVDAVRAGSLVWVSKDAPSGQLVDAIHAAADGEGYLPAALVGRVLTELAATRQHDETSAEMLGRLTARELEVLQCLVDGLDRQAIARRLYLTTNTVRTHVQNTLTKLDVHSCLEAVAVARRCGLQPRGELPTNR